MSYWPDLSATTTEPLKKSYNFNFTTYVVPRAFQV